MKIFRCAKCGHPHKFDETGLNAAQVMISCVKCKSRNIINLGPVLIAQSESTSVQFPLKSGENIVGRKSKGTDIGIILGDKYVSRRHANIRLEKNDDKLFISIEDLESTNGTFDRNKKKLKPKLRYPFLPGESFIVGLTKLTLKF
jgi:pSer/pThr/pTyr-binding forkhead associated (FHA) protein